MNLVPIIADGLRFWIFDIAAIASGLVTLFFSVVIIPYLRRHSRMQHELHAMARRTLIENTSLVLFGLFDGQLQSEFLGKTLTNFFGTVLSDLITEWDSHHTTAIVTPPDEDQASQMRYLAAAEASCFILQSHGLGCYFRNMEVLGTAAYPYSRIVVAVACPKADRLKTHRHPRIIAIGESDLLLIAADKDTNLIRPQWDTQDGWTWLAVLREFADTYVNGGQNGIEVLEMPNVHKPMNTEART